MRTVTVPGDKSMAHRALILGCLGSGESVIRHVSMSGDVGRTRDALLALGATISMDGEVARIAGPVAWRSPDAPVDCGNSGTSARLLLGLVAGLGLRATLDGDASLRRRPMDRIVYPLQAMGARIEYREALERLPVEVSSRATGALRPLRHRPRVASAQVKSGLLLAGLLSRTRVEVVEPVRSRDHTERMLAAMGAPVESCTEGDGWRATLEPAEWDGRLAPLQFTVPGDSSSAAFLIVAALLSGRALKVRDVGLNATRTGYLDVLRRAGAKITVEPSDEPGPEPTGDIVVEPSSLSGFQIGGRELVDSIDEVPILAIAAARANGVSEIRNAAELRVKESDRLALLAGNLRRIGVTVEEYPDGLRIVGTSAALAGRVETGADHRIAMGFAVLEAAGAADLEIDDRNCAGVSYPGFAGELERSLLASEAT